MMYLVEFWKMRPMYADRQMMNWKGFGRKWSWHNQGTILASAFSEKGKPQKPSG
jgi:hypothetical protein